MAAAPPPSVLTPEEEAAAQTDPMSGAVIRPPSAPQGPWNPAPLLKQILQTPVPGIPPLWPSQDLGPGKRLNPLNPVPYFTAPQPVPDQEPKQDAKIASAYPGAVPDEQHEQPKQDAKIASAYPGAVPDKEHEQPKSDAKIDSAYPGATPDEEHKQPQQEPIPQPQPQQPTPPPPAAQLTIPTPTPQGPTTTEAGQPPKPKQAAAQEPPAKESTVSGEIPGDTDTTAPVPPAKPEATQPAAPTKPTDRVVTGPDGKTYTNPTPETPGWNVRGPHESYEDYANRIYPSPKIQLPAPTGQDETPTAINGNRLYGTSTVFGLNYDRSIDPDDNGRGFFGGVNTRNPNLRAVAVPVDVLEGIFGKFTKPDGKGGYDALDTPEAKAIIAKIRSAHVELPDPNGKIHKFPIVDIQGSLKGHPGKVLDFTWGAAHEMGFTDNHAVSYQIIGGDGKPYPIPEIELTGGAKEGAPAGGPAGWTPLSGGALAGQPLFSIPTAGGGGGSQSAQPPSPSFDVGGGRGAIPSETPQGGGGSIGLFPSFGGGGGQATGGGTQAARRAQPPAEEEDPMVTALMNRGFTRSEAINFAQSSQAIALGKGIGPLQQPPPAPSGQAQLPAPVVTPKLLSAKQLMPSRYTKTPPPAAPSKPGQPKALPPPAPSATLGTGTISQAQRLPQAKQPPPPPPQQQPPAQFEAASHNMRPLGYRAAVRLTNGEVFSGPEHAHALDNAAENGSIRVSDKTTQFGFVDKDKNFISMEDADRLLEKNWYKERGLTPPQPAKEPTPFEGQRPGSTFAVPNPPGSEAIAKWPRLVDQAKQHAAILSPDDPRVKKQADGKIKGEHFVGGDPFHEQLLSGLPYGKTGRQGQILAQAEQAIGEKQPMHISYISSPAEAALHPTRESRTVQYEKHSPEARLMGTTEGQLVGHSLIPVSVGVTPAKKAGEPHESVIDGISTNVLANNFHHLNRKLAEMGRTTPYAQMDAKFTNALEGYLSNLNAGHAGTGRGHAVGTAEYPNEPDENHVPHYLTRLEADFINAAINNTAAFAKHEDGQALRRLAEANGTLITPAGETNRLLHEIEQHDPGWSGRGSGKRGRVLEPSIRTFKTGLIHEVHPSEEHMPATIRPGKEYQDLTKAIQRTSERGRPDVPVAISPRSQPIAAVPRDLAHNQLINRIEREFSEDRINEAEARQRLHAIGENPDEYRFVGGSGGLITPYEEDPEAITHEEHTQMKNNLRQQWVNGKMDVENYRQKVAEVPLPTKPSKPAAAAPPVTAPEEKPETPQTPAPAPKPLSPTPKPKPAPKAPPGPVAEPEEAPEEPAPAKAKPPAVDEPLPTPVKTPLEEAAPVKAKGPPAPDEPLPAPRAPEKPKETTEIQKKPGTEPIPEPLPAKPAAPPVEDTQQQKRIARKAEKAQEEEEEKLKEEVMRQAAADRDDISPEDQAGMNRLNKKAKTVAKQLGEIDPLSMHAHLTGQRTFPGKLKNEQIGEYYDANNPRLDYGKEEHRERVSHAVFHDIVHSLAGTTTGGKPSTAYGWYNRTVQKSLKKTAEVAPKILTDPAHALAWKLAWAITSQGQDVFPNTESTWAAYRHFHEHGRLPESRAIFGGGVKAEQMEENFKKINKLWHGDENQKGLGHEALQKRLMKRMTVGDLEKKFGMKVPGELKHHIVNGAMFMGAKIGSFFSNLNGDFDPTTMDLWFSRNMNLMAGNMFNFSDEATRKDRIEKGKVVKSHLNQLKEVLDSGMLSSVDPDKARKMSEELSALMAHPEGQLDRPTARALAPEIYDWARKQHNFYQQSPGLEGSYNKALKTPENTTAKKLDLGVSELSNAPRHGTEREQWRDIMRRAGDKLKAVGLKLVNADKQALLWFVIKDLFRMGGSPQRDKADYLDASHMLVHKVKTGKLPGLPVEQLEKAA